jgi:hypothetical protein
MISSQNKQYLIQVEGKNVAVVEATTEAGAVKNFKDLVHSGQLVVPPHKATAPILAVLKQTAHKALKFSYGNHTNCWKCGFRVHVDDIGEHLRKCKEKGRRD